MSEEVKYAGAMKGIGAVLILLSIVEFGLGGAVYGYMTNVHVGAWWGAICSFIAGICGMISNSRSVVITGLVFSILAIIISVVGAIVDGIASALLSAEDGCINTDNGDLYGSADGKYEAAYCAYFNYNNNYNNYNYYNYNNNGNFQYQCVCADSNANLCYGYDLASGGNCGLILTNYTNLLGASTAFLSVIAVLSLTYSIFTCIACGSNDGGAGAYAAPSVATNSAGIQVVQMTPGQPVYVQPGAGQPVVYAAAPQEPQHVPVAAGYIPQPVVYTSVVPTEPVKEAI